MKAILVMEMPEKCQECPMEMDVADTSGNLWNGNICRGCGKGNVDRCQKPDWCPLVPMPKRKEEIPLKEAIRHPYKNGFFCGWNACLDTIGRSGDDRGKA